MITTEDFLNNTNEEEVLGVIEPFINRYNEDCILGEDNIIIPDGQKAVYIKSILEDIKNCVWINPRGEAERSKDKKITMREETARRLLRFVNDCNEAALKEYLNESQIKELNDIKAEVYN